MAGKVIPLGSTYPAQKPDTVTTVDHLTTSAISARVNPDSLVGQRGLAIYSKMANDEQVKAVTTFKRDAITARGWQFSFRPSTKLSQQEQDKRRSLFDEILARMHGNFSDALNTIMTGRLFGFSITEKVYGVLEVDGKEWPAINRLLGRDPLTFRFYTDEFGLLARLEQQSRNGTQDVDTRRVIHYVHAPEWDQVYGRSDLREAYRSWYIKDQVVALWALYLERFASGFVHAELPAGENLGTQELEDLKTAIRTVKALGSLLTPAGVKVNVVYPGSTDAYKTALEYHDLAIAKALLVPNLLGISHTGQTGAYSQSQTQLEAFFWTLNADATRLEECLNEQLFRDLGDQCWGDGDYPEFRFKPASLEHTKWVLTTWKDLLGVKAVVPTEEDEAFIRKLMEMPARDDKSTPLVNPVEEQHRQEDMKAQADALAQTLEAKKQQSAAGKQTFAWDEGKHPRHGAGDSKGGEFAPKPTPAEGAAAIRAMSRAAYEDTPYYDLPGGTPAHNLYEAQKLLPKPSEKLKRVTDRNSMSLWSEYDFVANVDGRHYGISKYEDPDAGDDNMDDDGNVKDFVYAYTPLDAPSPAMTETMTASVQELLAHIRGKREGYTWDESKHPRRAAGSADVTGDGKGDGGKFAPKGGTKRGAAKDPATMTPGQINKELDRLDAEQSAIIDELIAAGRGHEKPSDMKGKDDPLSLRYWANSNRRGELRTEMEVRYGPNPPPRLPPGFKARRKAGEAKFTVTFDTDAEREQWLAALRLGSVLVLPEALHFTDATHDGIGVEVALPGCEAEALDAGTKLRMTTVGEGILEAEVLDFAWDEGDHPRHEAGSGDATGDGKGDGGKFAPKGSGGGVAAKRVVAAVDSAGRYNKTFRPKTPDDESGVRAAWKDTIEGLHDHLVGLGFEATKKDAGKYVERTYTKGGVKYAVSGAAQRVESSAGSSSRMNNRTEFTLRVLKHT